MTTPLGNQTLSMNLFQIVYYVVESDKKMSESVRYFEIFHLKRSDPHFTLFWTNDSVTIWFTCVKHNVIAHCTKLYEDWYPTLGRVNPHKLFINSE